MKIHSSDWTYIIGFAVGASIEYLTPSRDGETFVLWLAGTVAFIMLIAVWLNRND